jgi:chorismate mutase
VAQIDQDPLVRDLRDRITAVDLAILEAVNRRVELVSQLREHKARSGYDFVDPAREERLLSHLVEMNPGPLSAEGLEELFKEVLDLTKRETAGAPGRLASSRRPGRLGRSQPRTSSDNQ